jgi:hypothetical protein
MSRQPLPYKIEKGYDGKMYAVFPSSYDREQFNKRNPGELDLLPVACFGQYENAHCLTN